MAVTAESRVDSSTNARVRVLQTKVEAASVELTSAIQTMNRLTPPPFNFHGWRVAIAGGSRGIGRAMALAFAAAGASVSVCARGEDALNEVAQTITKYGVTAHSQSCDLADPDAIGHWIKAAANTLGGIDVLVNNASGFGSGATDADWLANVNIDLMAAVRASREALPYLKRSSNAAILHISSIAAFHSYRERPAYAAIKAALNQYTTSQAHDLAEHRIRVNAVAPGAIDFPDGRWDRRKREDPQRYAATLAAIPFGRFGCPEDVAAVALFLASPLAGWITGQILCVDGGQLLGT